MKRVLTAAVLLAVFIPVLVFSDTVAFPIFLAIYGAMCSYEACSCRGLEKKIYVLIPSALYIVFVPFSARIHIYAFIAATFCYAVYMFLVCAAAYGRAPAPDLLFSAFFIIFIAFGLYSIVRFRDAMPQRYLLVFLAPWISDAFAMYGGKLFGKKKLCPELSPKKTVAGAVSGAVGTMLTFVVFALVINLFFNGNCSYLYYLLASVPVAVLVQLGDLGASAVKRSCGIKDYGSIFPGHGGALDRCDSVLPVAIAAYSFSVLPYLFM